MLTHRRRGVDVQPALYYLRNMYNNDYSPLIRMKIKEEGQTRATTINIERYSEIAEQFESCLSGVLAEMFDPKKPFSQANDPLACTYCDYAAICGKKA